MTATPALSVIVATLDEEAHVVEVLDSLLDQDLEVPFEILVVDGGSTDRTRVLVEGHEAFGERLRLLDNPRRTAPHAFNIGIEAARGEMVAILGAHCRYDSNYLSACRDVVVAHGGAVACGGVVQTVPAGPDLAARLACAVLGNPFASSSKSFRTQRSGEVDSIPYPVYRTADLRDVGGFDVRLQRNQDNDLSERLRRRGVKMFVTDDTTAEYVARPDMGSLLRYAFHTGRWNGRTVRMGLDVLKPRHMVPSVFAAGLAAGLIACLDRWTPLGRLARRLVPAVLVLHLGLGARSAVAVESEVHGVELAALPPAIAAFHLAYGSGTLRGLADPVAVDDD
ncbi:MAG: glycosyltransferase [Microthrixaceae bacterium]